MKWEAIGMCMSTLRYLPSRWMDRLDGRQGLRAHSGVITYFWNTYTYDNILSKNCLTANVLWWDMMWRSTMRMMTSTTWLGNVHTSAWYDVFYFLHQFEESPQFSSTNRNKDRLKGVEFHLPLLIEDFRSKQQ